MMEVYNKTCLLDYSIIIGGKGGRRKLLTCMFDLRRTRDQPSSTAIHYARVLPSMPGSVELTDDKT